MVIKEKQLGNVDLVLKRKHQIPERKNNQNGIKVPFFYEINIFLLILLPNWKDFQWAGTYY